MRTRNESERGRRKRIDPDDAPRPRQVTLRVISPATPEHVSCIECAQCCRYVAVGIHPPHRPRYASDILWFLYHDRTSVHRDSEGDWSLSFESRCRHLGDDNQCGVYEHRPEICRALDENACEINGSGAERAITFRTPEEFLAWLARRYPRVLSKLVARSIPPGLALPNSAAVVERTRPRASAPRRRLQRRTA
jgi:Fe-S-cluster containining protein